MLFAWIGFLKQGQEVDAALQQQINGFLQQPFLPIQSAGVLRGPGGERAGYLVTFEAENRQAAEALVEGSPVREAGLYDQYRLFEYQLEVG